MLALFALCLAIPALLLLWQQLRKPAQNPFAHVARHSRPTPASKKPSWDVFHKSKIPEHVDAIIIGSGMGGLSTAVALSKAGKKVVVLEQHDVPGGCTHSFTMKGHVFETGLHYLGQLDEGSQGLFNFEQLTDGSLEWEHLGEPVETYHICGPDGNRVVAKTRKGWEGYVMSLIEAFPAEAGNIQKYVQLVVQALQSDTLFRWKTGKTAPLWMVKLGLLFPRFRERLVMKHYDVSLQTMLEQVTDNKELRAVLAAPYANHGCAPGDVSFAFHSGLVYYYMEGMWFPRGGSHRVAESMTPLIAQAGGVVLVQANVRSILTNSRNTAVTGVSVSRTGSDQPPIEIKCPLVVSAANLDTTFKLLPQLPSNSPMHKQYKPDTLKQSCSYFTLHVGFQHPTGEKLDLSKSTHMLIYDTDVNAAHKRVMASAPDDILKGNWPLVYVTFGSAKQGGEPSDKGSLQVIALCPHHWFDQWAGTQHNKRPEAYTELKDKLGAILWDQVKENFPFLNDYLIDVFEIGTPLSHNHYLGTAQGQIYGLDLDIARYSPHQFAHVRPGTPISGLVLSGQDIAMHGVAGAMFGGLLAASHILKRYLPGELIALKARESQK